MVNTSTNQVANSHDDAMHINMYVCIKKNIFNSIFSTWIRRDAF